MTTHELDELANTAALMPEGLDLADQAYFQAVRNLYVFHNSGFLNEDQARREKAGILRQHELTKIFGNLFRQNCENIRKSELMRTRIIKCGDDRERLLLALEVIDLCFEGGGFRHIIHNLRRREEDSHVGEARRQ